MSVNLLQNWSVDVAILTILIFYFVMQHDTRNRCYGYNTTNLLLSLGLVKLNFLRFDIYMYGRFAVNKSLTFDIYIDREYCTLTFRR